MNRLDQLDDTQLISMLEAYRKTLDDFKSRQLIADHSVFTKQINTAQTYDIEATTNANLQTLILNFRYTADNADYPLVNPFVRVTKTDDTEIDPNNTGGGLGIQTNLLLLADANPKAWNIVFAVTQNAVGTYTFRYKIYVYATDSGTVELVSHATA